MLTGIPKSVEPGPNMLTVGNTLILLIQGKNI